MSKVYDLLIALSQLSCSKLKWNAMWGPAGIARAHRTSHVPINTEDHCSEQGPPLGLDWVCTLVVSAPLKDNEVPCNHCLKYTVGS